jgi:hypothetical protein
VTIHLHDGYDEPHWRADLREAVDTIVSHGDPQADSPSLRLVRDLVEGETEWHGTEEELCQLVTARAALYEPAGETLNDYYRGIAAGIRRTMTGGPSLRRDDTGEPDSDSNGLTVRHAPGPGRPGAGDTDRTDEIRVPAGCSARTAGRPHPCITVGLTVLDGGARRTALAHWGPAVRSLGELFAALHEALPPDGTSSRASDDTQWFVVGGSEADLMEQAELLEYMRDQGMTRTTVLLNDEPGPGTRPE